MKSILFGLMTIFSVASFAQDNLEINVEMEVDEMFQRDASQGHYYVNSDQSAFFSISAAERSFDEFTEMMDSEEELKKRAKEMKMEYKKIYDFSEAGIGYKGYLFYSEELKAYLGAYIFPISENATGSFVFSYKKKDEKTVKPLIEKARESLKVSLP